MEMAFFGMTTRYLSPITPQVEGERPGELELWTADALRELRVSALAYAIPESWLVQDCRCHELSDEPMMSRC